VKYSEFKRWLERQGVQFVRNGKGSHMMLYYNGKKSVFPSHGAKEMKEGTRLSILKDLGLKP
jgi:mRNA interferase HicA